MKKQGKNRRGGMVGNGANAGASQPSGTNGNNGPMGKGSMGGRGIGQRNGGGGRGQGGGGGQGRGGGMGGGRGRGGGGGQGQGGRRGGMMPQGNTPGQGPGMAPPQDPEECMAGMPEDKRQRHAYDQSVFHRMLERYDAIHRELEHIDGGIRAVTTSDDPEIAKLLRDHVPSMHERLEENFTLRRWDPLYVEIFENRDKILMDVDLLPNGVRVVETSDDPYVAQLIQAHGEAVNAFCEQGFQAAQNPAPMPRDL
jgi:hypothetical protein